MVRVPNCPIASGCHAGGLGEDSLKIQRAERAEQQEHPQHEAEIADAVDDERLLARIRRGFLQEVETDEQVAAQAHAFPADEEQHEIGGENQNQHEEHEEIQVGEEAVVAAFVRHVAGGVNVNQEADAGDDQHHHDGELVQLQVESRAEIPGDNPVEERLHESLVIRRVVDERTPAPLRARRQRRGPWSPARRW